MAIITLEELKLYGDIQESESDSQLQLILNQAISIFEKYLNSPIENTDITETITIMEDSTTLMTKYRPINSVNSLTHGACEYTQNTDFVIIEDMVLYNLYGMFRKGVYEIVYNAGWGDAPVGEEPGTIPEGLKHGIMDLALWWWQRGDSAAIYETRALIPEQVKEVIRQYVGLI